MKTWVKNTDDKTREAELDLLIPIDAFVMKFTMEVGGKVIEGRVEEKKRAKKIFDKVCDFFDYFFSFLKNYKIIKLVDKQN